MVHIIPNIESVIARNAGVQKAVLEEGKAIQGRAKADLAAHRAEGDARIEINHSRPDVWVSLVDEAALSIEYGRSEYTRDDGVTVGGMEGLYIITKAGGL